MSEKVWHMSIRRLGTTKGDANDIQFKRREPRLHDLVKSYQDGKLMRGEIVGIEPRPGNPHIFIVHVDELESERA